jgi:hypothetical protein
MERLYALYLFAVKTVRMNEHRLIYSVNFRVISWLLL